MWKLLRNTIPALVGAFAPAALAAGEPPNAAACLAAAHIPAILLTIDGFKTRTGTLRVQIYGSNPAEFLAKGKRQQRIDLAVPAVGPASLCIALPVQGRYAISVFHDTDGNGERGWSDGGGFSNNPKLSI